MTRAQRKQNTADLIKGYVEEFKRRLKADIGYDIRARIDRENRYLLLFSDPALMARYRRDWAGYPNLETALVPWTIFSRKPLPLCAKQATAFWACAILMCS